VEEEAVLTLTLALETTAALGRKGGEAYSITGAGLTSSGLSLPQALGSRCLLFIQYAFAGNWAFDLSPPLLTRSSQPSWPLTFVASGLTGRDGDRLRVQPRGRPAAMTVLIALRMGAIWPTGS